MEFPAVSTRLCENIDEKQQRYQRNSQKTFLICDRFPPGQERYAAGERRGGRGRPRVARAHPRRAGPPPSRRLLPLRLRRKGACTFPGARDLNFVRALHWNSTGRLLGSSFSGEHAKGRRGIIFRRMRLLRRIGIQHERSRFFLASALQAGPSTARPAQPAKQVRCALSL